jgi:uncharacterized protein (DUF58 family)
VVSAGAEIVLARRQLFMLPTRHGWLYALLLMVLLLAAINYGNGLVYGLAFLLASVGVVSMLHTHRNVSGLRVGAGHCPSVFAGEPALFSICLVNDSDLPRYGVAVEHERREVARLDLAARETHCLTLPVPTRKRGWLAIPDVVVTTRFPLGILYSWSRQLQLPARCLVYPAPAPEGYYPGAPAEAGGEGGARVGQGDDFVGQREYRAGDSLKHVNWKALAREQGWYTKEYGGGAASMVWFDWDLLAGLDTETRLSILCRQVLEAERGSLAYGLRLPGGVIAPGNGEAHEQRCLEALALFSGGTS